MGSLGFLLGMTNSLTLVASQNAAPKGLEGAASGLTKTLVTILGAVRSICRRFRCPLHRGVECIRAHLHEYLSCYVVP